MVYVFMADGFEIVEAMAPIDMLRRAKIAVITVGVGSKTVTSSCGIPIVCDITEDNFVFKDVDAIILPGGPGTQNLENSEVVQYAIDSAYESNVLICAICAAPSILGHKGILRDKEVICFPGYEKELDGATISKNSVVTDGDFITAKGAGVAIEFGLEIVKQLDSDEMVRQIKGAIQCQ